MLQFTFATDWVSFPAEDYHILEKVCHVAGRTCIAQPQDAVNKIRGEGARDGAEEGARQDKA